MIYIILNKINKRMYVGKTLKDDRYDRHLYALRKKIHWNKLLQLDFNNFGEDNFVFIPINVEIYKIKNTYKGLEWLETYLILTMTPLYNIAKKNYKKLSTLRSELKYLYDLKEIDKLISTFY